MGQDPGALTANSQFSDKLHAPTLEALAVYNLVVSNHRQ